MSPEKLLSIYNNISFTKDMLLYISIIKNFSNKMHCLYYFLLFLWFYLLVIFRNFICIYKGTYIYIQN